MICLLCNETMTKSESVSVRIDHFGTTQIDTCAKSLLKTQIFPPNFNSISNPTKLVWHNEIHDAEIDKILYLTFAYCEEVDKKTAEDVPYN